MAVLNGKALVFVVFSFPVPHKISCWSLEEQHREEVKMFCLSGDCRVVHKHQSPKMNPVIERIFCKKQKKMPLYSSMFCNTEYDFFFVLFFN